MMRIGGRKVYHQISQLCQSREIVCRIGELEARVMRWLHRHGKCTYKYVIISILWPKEEGTKCRTNGWMDWAWDHRAHQRRALVIIQANKGRSHYDYRVLHDAPLALSLSIITGPTALLRGIFSFSLFFLFFPRYLTALRLYPMSNVINETHLHCKYIQYVKNICDFTTLYNTNYCHIKWQAPCCKITIQVL